MKGEVLKASQWFDSLKLNRLHLLTMVLVGCTLGFNGYNNQIIAYVMPQVIREWNLSPVDAGFLASYGFIGLMVGAAVFGMMSDRLGRKAILMLTLAILCFFSGLGGFVHNFHAFAILRFLAGLGMGGVMPTAITLVSEVIPSRIRAQAVTAMFGGFNLGGAAAALAAMGLMPSQGWRSVVIVGIVPMLFIPVIWLYLPESIRFLALRKRYRQAEAVVRRMEKAAGIPPARWEAASFAVAGQTDGGLKGLFAGGLTGMTILVWLTYFLNLLVIYGLSIWLPSLLVNAGFSLVKSYSYGVLQSLGAAFGGFLLGWVMDRYGRKFGLVLFYLLGGVAVWLFAFASSNLAFFLAGTASGLFVMGVQNAQHVVTGEIYPTQVRSTGVGWALTMGRLGSVTAPILGGVLQFIGLTYAHYCLIFALPCLCCALLAALYRLDPQEAEQPGSIPARP